MALKQKGHSLVMRFMCMHTCNDDLPAKGIFYNVVLCTNVLAMYSSELDSLSTQNVSEKFCFHKNTN